MKTRNRIFVELLSTPLPMALLVFAAPPAYEKTSAQLVMVAATYGILLIPSAILTSMLELGFKKGLKPEKAFTIIVAGASGALTGLLMTGCYLGYALLGPGIVPSRMTGVAVLGTIAGSTLGGITGFIVWIFSPKQDPTY